MSERKRRFPFDIYVREKASTPEGHRLVFVREIWAESERDLLEIIEREKDWILRGHKLDDDEDNSMPAENRLWWTVRAPRFEMKTLDGKGAAVAVPTYLSDTTDAHMERD